VSFARKGAIVLTGGALVIAGSLAPTTFAASPSQEQCEAQGGTFDRTNGTVTCTTTETGKNPKFTEESQTSGQGNTGNKTEQSSDCDGTGSDKCPPGQFPG
jgi:hypothetical protein